MQNRSELQAIEVLKAKKVQLSKAEMTLRMYESSWDDREEYLLLVSSTDNIIIKTPMVLHGEKVPGTQLLKGYFSHIR